jgi:diguanylate cyclase (GGDEF)-like protein/PAS domain S-box-containing protein
VGEEATLFAAVLQAFEEAGAAWEPVLDVVCRLGARLTGDPWVIRLVDEHGSQQLGGVAAPDPAFEADLRRVIEEADPAYSNSLVAQVLRDGRPVLLTQAVLAAARDSVAPQHRALAESHGIVGGALLPMRVRGITIGSLWVPCTAHHGRHDDEDLRFFADVADRCALAIDNARLLRQLQAQQDRHAALLAHVSDAIAVVDHAGLLVQASAGVRRQLGWTEAELLGTNMFELVHPDDAAAALEGFLNVMDVDDRPPATLRVKHADGTWRWMDINADNLLEHPAVRGVVITAHDVTERVAADVLLNAENEVLELIATGAPVDEVLTSVCALADGHLRAGASSVWLLDQVSDDLVAAAGPPGVFAVASQGQIGATWARSLVGGRVWVSDPHDAPEWERFRDLAVNANIGCSWTRSISDSAGELVGAVVVYVAGALRKPSAIEAKVMELAARLAGLAVERSRSAERLAHAATHDPVTGLPNRRLLHERLRTAVGHQSDGAEPPALLFIDLDRFKQVNDRAGHAVGDDVLRELGVRLRSCARDGDLVARFGGDEFGVLCEGATEDEAVAIAERMLVAIAQPIVVAGARADVSASIGVAVGRRGVNADQLIRRADRAMYRAKAAGAGRIVRYRSGMSDGGRAELEHDLRVAIEDGDITLHYQPLIDIQLGRWIGVEGLARWSHETRGWVPPATFIPLAEESGLIASLGDKMLDIGLRQGAAWHEEGLRGINVAINVSSRQLAEKSFGDAVAAKLAETGFPARRLVLELTETVMMEDWDSARAVVAKMQALGVHLSIDDFGTGHSTLARLRQFPASGLKLDRTFVLELGRDPASEDVVAAVVQLAHAVRMAVMAEGVETVEQLRVLRRLGVDAAQGYLFGHPMPPAECAKVLRRPCDVMARAGLPPWPPAAPAPTTATAADRSAAG